LPKDIDRGLKEQWGNFIIQCYYEGLEAYDPLIPLGGNSTKNLGRVIAEDVCITGGKIEEIPELFLESLTYEGSFTQKIVNTISLVR
jgi:hypothetical protein